MLKTLQSIIQELSRIKSLDLVLATLVQRVAETIDVEVCNIFLLDPHGKFYTLAATCGLDQSLVSTVQMKCGEGLVGLVGERGTAVNLGEASAHERFHHYVGLDETPYNAFLGVPIIYQGRLLGVLTVLRHEKVRFDEAEEALLVTLSTQLSGMIALMQVSGSLALDKVDRDQVKTKQMQPKILQGLPTSSKVAIGHALVVYPLTDLSAVPERTIVDEKIDQEIKEFTEAIQVTRDEVRVLGKNLSQQISSEEQALFDAYIQILESEGLLREVTDQIQQGLWAQTALKQVIFKHIAQFEDMDDPYMRERASDIKDLGQRVLSHLQLQERVRPDYPKDTILVGEEVTPSVIAEVPEGRLKGILSAKGSTNSHVAILARALGIPSVMGVEGLPIEKMDGQRLIVDGFSGQVTVSPSDELCQQFQALIAEEAALDEDLEGLRDKPAETKDGYGLSLYVNTGLAADIRHALSVGADGVGLFRTEVPFMVRDRFPSEEEQRVIYHQLLKAFSPRPVMMRTLDIGGDKILPYFPVAEDNPFLGWRGIRITLDHPEIFMAQVRAMLRASAGLNNLHIMFPMVSSIHEVDEALRLTHQAYSELKEEGEEITMPALGAMIEIPSAVYQARALAKRVDFLSVGTNDLIQYLLAVDRNNARVAKLYDHLHPAVLKALKQAVESAHAEGKHISICGEMAGDPVAVILLLAMGFDTLSVSGSRLPRVKWVIRQFTLEKAKELLAIALEMDDAATVHHHMEMTLDAAGLGGLIRAGR